MKKQGFYKTFSQKNYFVKWGRTGDEKARILYVYDERGTLENLVKFWLTFVMEWKGP